MPLTQPLPAGFPWLVPTFPQGAQVVPDRLLHVGHGVVLRCVDTRAGPHHETQDRREAEFRYEVAGQEALEERRSQQGAILRGQRGVRLRDGTGRGGRAGRPQPSLPAPHRRAPRPPPAAAGSPAAPSGRRGPSAWAAGPRETHKLQLRARGAVPGLPGRPTHLIVRHAAAGAAPPEGGGRARPRPPPF